LFTSFTQPSTRGRRARCNPRWTSPTASSKTDKNPSELCQLKGPEFR
jgi:hypothetical protein